jgi:hypothetical protein
MLAGDKSDMPGMVRISFGLYNTKADVDELLEALNCISGGKFQGEYTQIRATGEYIPANWNPNFSQYFSF